MKMNRTFIIVLLACSFLFVSCNKAVMAKEPIKSTPIVKQVENKPAENDKLDILINHYLQTAKEYEKNPIVQQYLFIRTELNTLNAQKIQKKATKK